MPCGTSKFRGEGEGEDEDEGNGSSELQSGKVKSKEDSEGVISAELSLEELLLHGEELRGSSLKVSWGVLAEQEFSVTIRWIE